MWDVCRDLENLYKEHGIEVHDRYRDAMRRALDRPSLSFGTPAMYGITSTVLSSKKMIAHNLVQNSIDEAKGAARIQIIADRYADPALAEKMKRHVAEELKHSKLFLDLVDVTGYSVTSEDVDETVDDVMDFDDDVKAFICRVHSIEIRSWTVLRTYQQVLNEQRFPEVSEVAIPTIDDIMQDEINHVLYTGQTLDGWLEEDESLLSTLEECFAHTDRETWQDMASMVGYLAEHRAVALA